MNVLEKRKIVYSVICLQCLIYETTMSGRIILRNSMGPKWILTLFADEDSSVDDKRRVISLVLLSAHSTHVSR